MKKRIVSFLMALVMVVSVLPVSAFAEELPAEAPVAAQAVTEGVAGTEEPLTEPAPTAEEGDAAVGDSETSAKPTITTDLAETVAVKTGDALTLTIAAEGTGTLSYQWYVGNTYNGTKIRNATEASYNVAVDKEQITYYYVAVTNTEEGKTPATVYSAIAKVVVSDDGSGEFSDTPVITSDVTDKEDVVLPWDSLKGREFSVSVKELGMTQLSYQWYRNTNRSYDGAELISGATKDYYNIRGTTVLGTSYYFCVITNTLADGTTKSTRSAIGGLTIKAPEKMEFGIVIGEEPVGTVNINVSDTVPKRDDLINGMGEPMEDPGPYGDLVGNANAYGRALIYPSDTMMTIIARALIEDGHRQVGGENGYIKTIIANYGTDDSVELSEFRRGKGSGWMGTLNGWCTNTGFANYTVAKGDIQDGDTIDVMYTTDLGKDIGCDFNATDMSLESLSLLTNERGDSNYAYSVTPDNFSGSKYNYEKVLDAGVTGFKVKASLVEKQFVARVFVGDTEYRLNSEVIPFTGDTLTLTVKTMKPASGTATATEGKTYTITLIRDQKLLNQKGDMKLDLLLKSGSVVEQGALEPSYSEEKWEFSTIVPAYTPDERKNVTGFVLSLPNIPEGTTGEVITPSGASYPIMDGAVTVKNEIAQYGTFVFTVRLTSGDSQGIYTLSVLKRAASLGLSKLVLAGKNQDFDPENIYNGQPEGTLFRVDKLGQETGETGFDSNWYQYNMHLTEKITALKSAGNTSIWLIAQSKVKITTNGTPQFDAAAASGMLGIQFKKIKQFPLSGEKTDIVFRIENAKNADEVVTYTIHVIRHSIEVTELEALIRALPEVDGFVYSEHLAALQQAKKIFDEANAEVQAEVSAELVEKLNALWAEKDRQYDEGIALIEAVQAEVSKYKDAIPADTTELTDELYQQYGEAIRASGKLYDKLQGWVLTQWNNGGYAEKAVLANALKLLNRYETSNRKTIGQATDYLDDFMLTNSAFNLTLGSAWDAYPVTFRDITYSKTKLGGEAGLPWNTPGRLRFEIDDPTIFEIKEVLGVYGDRGLGGGGNYDNMLYYLIPLKEGTTTFRVTLTDETGTFYGQTPEMIVHVNSEAEASIEKLADKLTNINSLPRTTKYDIHYFWQGQEGAPFTFKVNGDNAKVYVWEYLGGGKKTEYAVNSDGTVTVILKDGYNPIEVTADYQGQRVTQTYGLKGKVIDYTITNVTRPGQAPRLGDTIDLKITGLSVPVYKILRIYNPAGPRFVYLTEDLPQQYQLNGNNDQYHIGTMRIVLTGSGIIHLTDGHIFETWLGSALGSELSQGNTGEIAPQAENKFSVLPDLSFEVAEYAGYTGQVQVNTEVETGNTVRAGQKITINLLNLPTDELAAKYPCVTTSTTMKLQSIQTIFGTNIPGLATVESELVKNPLSGREVSLDPITSITVTIPKDTPAGTYKIYGGYVKLRRGDPSWSIATENLYERQIQDIELTVLPAADYSDIYTTTGDYIASLGTPTVGSVGGEWMALGLARSGRTVPSGYYDNVVKYVKENIDSNGRLDRTKTTENARVILALTAIGKDPTNVGGYNLLDGFYNMKGCLLGQGVNAPIFALLALDSHNYTPTHDDVTRESLVELILSDQVKADGGWALEGATAEASDVDMTAMAIQALAPYYKTNANVKSAVDKALGLLSTMQQPDGGYASWYTVNSESCAQVIVALTALGIDPTVDSRFIKNSISVLDALCSYYVTGGGFSHTSGEGRDGMATEQGYYALAAYYRFVNKQNRLYDMTDVCVTHTFGEWTTVKEATCTEAGSEKRVCSICSAEETRSIEALGHKFGEWTVTKKATCTEKGSQTRTCSVCQATETQDIAALGHSFGKWVVTKEATRTEEGLKTRTCSVCSATETQVIPALGNRPSNPGTGNSGTNKPAEDVKSSQTGDNSQIAMWMSSVMLSAAALVVLTRKRKHSAK